MTEARWKVTGVLTSGARFKPILTNSLRHALGINLYRGTVWVREGEHWRVVKRVHN